MRNLHVMMRRHSHEIQLTRRLSCWTCTCTSQAKIQPQTIIFLTHLLHFLTDEKTPNKQPYLVYLSKQITLTKCTLSLLYLGFCPECPGVWILRKRSGRDEKKYALKNSWVSQPERDITAFCFMQ